MERLLLNCKSLDDLLGGGIEYGIITEFYGAAGTGKTNICLQASRECVMYGKKAVYIDTEGVSVERLQQICKNNNYKKILSEILFFNPGSFEEQELAVVNAIKMKGLGLIIIDTINMFYRMKLEDDEEGAERSLIRQLTNLQLAARQKEICVIITGQVYTAEDGDFKPFAGRGIEHMAKTIVKVEKMDIGKRRAVIIKHRSQPEGKKAVFAITQNGLE